MYIHAVLELLHVDVQKQIMPAFLQLFSVNAPNVESEEDIPLH
jgi:hypothetical protein